MDMWFTDDRENICAFTERHGVCVEKTFPFGYLRPLATTKSPLLCAVPEETYPLVLTSKERFFDITDCLRSSGSGSGGGCCGNGVPPPATPLPDKFHFYTFRWANWRLFDEDDTPSAPKRRSYIFTYLDENVTAAAGSAKRWLVAQYYVPRYNDDDDDDRESTTPPVRKFIMDLGDPVIVPYRDSISGQPILDCTFNHVGWIDQETVSQTVPLPSIKLGNKGKLLSSTRRKRRVVRLLTFPDDIDRLGSDVYGVPIEPKVVTLRDIPEKILDVACHIIIEPAMGAILIPTESKGRNEVHRFQYA